MSLSVASCQTAYSTLTVRTSKEPELKGLKKYSVIERSKNVYYLAIYFLLQIFKNPNIAGDTAISKSARLMEHPVYILKK